MQIIGIFFTILQRELAGELAIYPPAEFSWRYSAIPNYAESSTSKISVQGTNLLHTMGLGCGTSIRVLR